MGKLSKAEAIEAEIIAAHLLARHVSAHQVHKKLREDLGVSYTQSNRIVKKVQDRWDAEAAPVISDIRSESYRTLDEAVQLAFAQKDVRAVVAVERLRAEIAGLTKIDLHIGGAAKPEDERPWKTEAEADCFATMGKLPRELSETESKKWEQIQALRGIPTDATPH